MKVNIGKTQQIGITIQDEHYEILKLLSIFTGLTVSRVIACLIFKQKVRSRDFTKVKKAAKELDLQKYLLFKLIYIEKANNDKEPVLCQEGKRLSE